MKTKQSKAPQIKTVKDAVDYIEKNQKAAK